MLYGGEDRLAVHEIALGYGLWFCVTRVGVYIMGEYRPLFLGGWRIW